MNECLAVEDLLEPTPQALAHAAQCVTCQVLVDDLADLTDLTRAQPQASWAGGPLVEPNVEQALSAVLTRARVQQARRTKWLLRLTTSAAAALVLFSVVTPWFLRLRIEHTPEAPQATTWAEDQQLAIWFTTPANP